MSDSGHSFDAFLTPSSSDSTDSTFDTPKKPKLMGGDKGVLICHICKQNILDPNTKFFQSLPESAVEEEAALTDNRLLLYCDGELIPEIDIKPLHKITHFTVFDGEGHLCPFDSGIIENDQLIFFSGYIKPIYEDDPSPKNGVPAQELGPILEWWISGFDGGNSFIVAFSTPYADYILMEPSSDYESFMRSPKQKALLTKIVVEFLGSSLAPTYDELLSRINEVSVPEDIEPLDEHCLGKHAQFVIDQIYEVDDGKKLISTPAAQEMIRIFKVNTRRTVRKKKFRMRNMYKPTTTALVYDEFRFFFNVGDWQREEEEEEQGNPPVGGKLLSKFSWEKGSDSALVNEEVISVKDFVFINTNSEKSNRIFRIEYFFQQNFTKQAHCRELIRGKDTILGEASHPWELFFLEECSNWPICKLIKKADVVMDEPPKSWREFLTHRRNRPRGRFFVQKCYLRQNGIFVDFKDGDSCAVCRGKEEQERSNTPSPVNGKKNESGMTVYDKIIWRNEEYVPGCCVFLEPFSVVFDAQKSSRRIEKTLVTLKTDELIYPEVYRKAKEVSLTEECPEPFVVARIKNVFSRSEGPQKKLFLTVNKFYRPENTRVLETFDKKRLDLQLLFWSNEEVEVLFDHVRGICDVVFSQIPPAEVSPHPVFYFNSSFNADTETFAEVEPVPLIRPEEEDIAFLKRLKTLNAFSGCGGLAEGLRQSGIAEILWAVEIDKSTCRAFKSNFPSATVFEKDCNSFLADVTSGRVCDENGSRYPVRGEVELLCGGPPCQGFSTMNRFSSKEDSQYNNSLILTYLSFCDYYRPKYFLLENVRNFVAYKKSVFMKHVIACLVAMGYQCNFGVIQAGNYGVPQTRRRLFILAAAPGLTLPDFPKPTHVFYGSVKDFEYELNGSKFFCKISNDFSGSAAYRHVTIWDAVSDLPRTKGKSVPENTYYKRFLAGRTSQVRDHVSKEMSSLNEARIRHIPASKGCDWRDLPNVRVRLRDGTVTNVLRYSHHDRKNGKSCCGALRGVCGCASGKVCDPKDRQNNTLIPWFLVHTANRNNNWSGLYGRLDWEGVFNTVTTNPEPSGQQGKVLHPEEDRVISVRESARAQGLPDSLKLFGTVAERYKQVGNAVPSPVARAIGFEIRSSLMYRDL